MGSERRALEVRQRMGDGVVAGGSDGLAQRALGPDENGACDEELGNVDVECRPRSAECRRREVDQHGATVG